MKRDRLEVLDGFLKGLQGEAVSIDLNTKTEHIAQISIWNLELSEQDAYYIINDTESDIKIYIVKNSVIDLVEGFDEIEVNYGDIKYTITKA